MVRAAVVGAAGYTGIETVRLLLGHPGFEVTTVTSAADAGNLVEDLYPGLTGCGLRFEAPDIAKIAADADVAFLAVPHTAALDIAPALLDAGLKVFDLSADFRLNDAAVYETWYAVHHTAPELLESAVYGLPELSREGLVDATLVACPGCYPTASAIAVAPAYRAGLTIHGGRVVIDAKSGVSGAGRKANAATHYVTANESMRPYGVGSHRHTPEIAQTLAALAGSQVSLCFTPHLVPLSRGLLATAYLQAVDGLTTEDAVGAYMQAYADEPFVTVHPAGRMPATHDVVGTNRAHVGVAVDEASSTLVVACAIDNLVKGSGGQALQCANIALGFEETTGLAFYAPVV